jgi:hypothetical protein
MVQWYWFVLPNVRNENPTRELDGADGIRYREISVQLRVIRQQRQRPTLLPEIDVGVGAEQSTVSRTPSPTQSAPTGTLYTGNDPDFEAQAAHITESHAGPGGFWFVGLFPVAQM